MSNGTYRICDPALPLATPAYEAKELDYSPNSWAELAHMVVATRSCGSTPCPGLGSSSSGIDMKAIYKIPKNLVNDVRKDISRPHAFAYERVGYLLGKSFHSADGNLTIVGYKYLSVPDSYYIPDEFVGARFGSKAIHQALEAAFNEGGRDVSVFHIHSHIGVGIPWFSQIDMDSAHEFVPDIFNMAPKMPHGILVMNEQHIAGMIWLDKTTTQPLNTVKQIGFSSIFSDYE